MGDLWSHALVITVNKYFPFTLPQEKGVLPHIGHTGMNTLKGYGFLDILVRNRVLFSNLERIACERRRISGCHLVPTEKKTVIFGYGKGATQPRPIIFFSESIPPHLPPPPTSNAHLALRVEGTFVYV